MLLLFCVILFFSCGTRKSSTVEKKNLHIESDDSIRLVVEKRDSFFTQLLVSNKTILTVTITELSLPDSLGVQYPVRVTQATLSHDQEKEKITRSGNESEAIATQTGKNILNDEGALETNEKSNTRLIPSWGWWALFVGAWGVGVILFKRRQKLNI